MAEVPIDRGWAWMVVLGIASFFKFDFIIDQYQIGKLKFLRVGRVRCHLQEIVKLFFYTQELTLYISF